MLTSVTGFSKPFDAGRISMRSRMDEANVILRGPALVNLYIYIAQLRALSRFGTGRNEPPTAAPDGHVFGSKNPPFAALLGLFAINGLAILCNRIH